MKRIKWTAHGKNEWTVTHWTSTDNLIGVRVKVHNRATNFYMTFTDHIDALLFNLDVREKIADRLIKLIEADPEFVNTDGPRKGSIEMKAW
jgi:hypothetical protein